MKIIFDDSEREYDWNSGLWTLSFEHWALLTDPRFVQVFYDETLTRGVNRDLCSFLRMALVEEETEE